MLSPELMLRRKSRLVGLAPRLIPIVALCASVARAEVPERISERFSRSDDLTGYRISAQETNVTFNANQHTLEFLERLPRSKLDQQTIAHMEQLRRTAATNTT